MPSIEPVRSIEHSFHIVNPPLNSQLPLFSDSMIHHKVSQLPERIIVSYKYIERYKRYGVSSSRRVLSPQLLLKRFDQVRDCLQYALGLPTGEREAVLRILRFWAYYGQVYVKQAQISENPGVSKATYWRAIRRLKDRGLIRVINRFVIRPHAQISNLYQLDKLVLVIARWLAEHGTGFLERWLQPYLSAPGRVFWTLFLVSGRGAPAPVISGQSP